MSLSGPHICLHQLATRHPLAHRGLGAAYQRPLTPSSSTANTCVMRDTASNSIASRAPYISSRTPPLPPRPTRTQLPIPGGGCLNTHSTTPAAAPPVTAPHFVPLPISAKAPLEPRLFVPLNYPFTRPQNYPSMRHSSTPLYALDPPRRRRRGLSAAPAATSGSPRSPPRPRRPPTTRCRPRPRSCGCCRRAAAKESASTQLKDPKLRLLSLSCAGTAGRTKESASIELKAPEAAASTEHKAAAVAELRRIRG